MPGLDALPPDQRAVLQLVLRRGRSYDDLAGLLNISPQAVRERAHAGADALVPVTGPRPGEAERGQIADWLLGQGDNGARGLLDEPGSARDWGRRLRSELAPLAPRDLPLVPDDPPAARRLEPLDAGASVQPVATGARAAESGRGSRLGGALLLGGIGVLIAAVVAFALTRGGDDKKTTSTRASTSTSTQATSGTGTNAIRTVAQINLKPAQAGSKTLAVAQLAVQGNQGAFFLAAQGLQVVAGTYHGIWLTGPKARPAFLGGIINRNVKNGRVSAQARVPNNVASYNAMLVTREQGATPAKTRTRPGKTVLRGALKVTASAGG